MKTPENVAQKFQVEIEVERIRTATEQGIFMFLAVLVFTIVLVLVLWDNVSRYILITWFIALNTINFTRWAYLQFYRSRINPQNPSDIKKIKFFLLVGALTSGSCWGIANLLFIDEAQPYTLLVMSITTYFVSMGAILSWFNYMPAVIVFFIPTIGSLVIPLFVQGTDESFSFGFILTVSALCGLFGSFKIGRIYDSALRLNFENVALRLESEEKSLLLETALENMNQGISMSDRESKLRMWNRQFVDLLGPAGNNITVDTDIESILSALPLKMQSIQSAELRLNDGRIFQIRQTELQHGGRVLTYTDISDLIKRERALEKARKTAEQANAAKTRFLAAASHDLRQPIHALSLFFAELSDRVREPENNILITQIDESIGAINSMLNALLDVSKLDAGVVKPKIANFKLATLFTRLESEFMPIALENRNRLKIRHTSTSVRSDPTMLERMLRNLIGNALRYTENGRVLVAARSRGDNVQIQVFDNGRGIPENQLDEIFIEFHQVSNPARDRRQGLGLGLAIVKRLANLLKHEIKVVSNLGRGSCFSITLPHARVDHEMHDVKLTNRPVVNSLAKYSILLLDDDMSVLEGMRRLLTHWGCRQVITALSSDEAFKQIDRYQVKPDLLIIDYRLAENESGIEVGKKIQSCFLYPLPVILLTGDTAPERLKEAIASGFRLLHKPVELPLLRLTIQELLESVSGKERKRKLF
ncbi:ATP-binding protein [Nitrosomonas sp.]|uniref:hybrid sensor histidine kinase/response regulator n=1 Tax=Nitrosomonas sp. TaxID=42353 RepID=UPI002630422E|nr:ATP-binding protein [Nitrosomonas sp.]